MKRNRTILIVVMIAVGGYLIYRYMNHKNMVKSTVYPSQFSFPPPIPPIVNTGNMGLGFGSTGAAGTLPTGINYLTPTMNNYSVALQS